MADLSLKAEIERLLDENDRLRSEATRFRRRLADAYRDRAVIVADLCDGYLDRSGCLLGEVRGLARRGGG